MVGTSEFGAVGAESCACYSGGYSKHNFLPCLSLAQKKEPPIEKRAAPEVANAMPPQQILSAEISSGARCGS